MIPRLKPTLGVKELSAALRVPAKDDVIRFEQNFAKLMDQGYALAFPYGRTGLLFLLKALGIEDQEIICPAYTCVVVPHAIKFSGNTPVFVDCESDGFNMDLDLVGKAISKKTGAIVATSIFGYPVNLDKLDEIREKFPKVHIIQDCAHSFAARWRDRPVQKEGIAAVFGLNISKLLTSIFGGMITTDDYTVYNKLKQLRDNNLNPASWKKSIRRLIYLIAVYLSFTKGSYGVINRLERAGILDQFVKYYDETTINMPDDYLAAMTNVEARVGMANIERYEDIINNRVAAATHYFNVLRDYPGLELPPRVSGATYSHFVGRVTNRAGWLQKGLKDGLQFGWLIEYCIPMMTPYGASPGDKFPVSARYAKTTINLPVWGGEETARKVTTKLAAAQYNVKS